MTPNDNAAYAIYPLLLQLDFAEARGHVIGAVGYDPFTEDLRIELLADWKQGLAEDVLLVLAATFEQFRQGSGKDVMRTLESNCANSLRLGDRVGVVEATCNSVQEHLRQSAESQSRQSHKVRSSRTRSPRMSVSA